MKRTDGLIYLTILLVIIGCKSNDESINGHWHTVTPGFGTFATLDISDSLSVMDKYKLGDRPDIQQRVDRKTGKQYLPFQDYEYTDKYHRTGDTLYIGDSTFAYKYVPSDIRRCELVDRYVSSVIDISLISNSTSETYDKLYYDSFCVDLFVGSKANRNCSYAFPYFDNLTKQFPDSVFIQAEDVLLKINNVKSYSDNMTDLWPKGKTTHMVIHVDKNVPPTFLKRVLDEIPDSFIKYRAVTNDKGELGVTKIVED